MRPSTPTFQDSPISSGPTSPSEASGRDAALQALRSIDARLARMEDDLRSVRDGAPKKKGWFYWFSAVVVASFVMLLAFAFLQRLAN